MHLQNIACAVFAVKGMGKGGCWWVSMCSPIDIKQSSDMEMGGQGKNGSLLRLCLDVGQGLSLLLSIYHYHSFFLSQFSQYLTIGANLCFASGCRNLGNYQGGYCHKICILFAEVITVM